MGNPVFAQPQPAADPTQFQYPSIGETGDMVGMNLVTSSRGFGLLLIEKVCFGNWLRVLDTTAQGDTGVSG
jgi:hypothetical protein